MVDSEYSMDIYKSLKINVWTVTRNIKMLKFIPDHLKTEKMCKISFTLNMIDIIRNKIL